MSPHPRRPPEGPAAATCSCGRLLDSHDQHVRFRLPDPVLSIPVEEREDRTWETDAMMEVDGLGSFVRALLPVQLVGGHKLTFGLWLAVTPEDLRRAFDAWWAPTYEDLVLDGHIANQIELWDILARPARAVVRDVDVLPYIDSSHDHTMQHVINDVWDHDFALQALPSDGD